MAALWDPGTGPAQVKAMEVPARSLEVQLQVLEVRKSDEIADVFEVIKRERAGAVNVLASPLLHRYRKRIIDPAAKTRLPAIYQWSESVEDGGLMAYGPILLELHRRLATYIDKILKGAKPAELPFEQPTKFEFIINLKAAKQIGLTIPPNVLARADKVIK